MSERCPQLVKNALASHDDDTDSCSDDDDENMVLFQQEEDEPDFTGWTPIRPPWSRISTRHCCHRTKA